MLRTAYAIFLGLFGAGIVHIAILLLLPALSDRDAWSRLAAGSDLQTFIRLDGTAGGVALRSSADPHFQAAACRFDLSEAHTRVEAAGSVPFWSVSVYNRAGQNIYSFNDRTAVDGILDLVLATPVQATALRRSPPAALEQSIVVEIGTVEGIVVLRSFVPDESWRPKADAFLSTAQCAVGG